MRFPQSPNKQVSLFAAFQAFRCHLVRDGYCVYFFENLLYLKVVAHSKKQTYAL